MQLFLDELAINDPANGYFLDEQLTGLTGFPQIRTSGGVNVGRDGGWVSRQLYDARFISISGRFFSTDKTQAEDVRQAMAAVLARKEVTLKVVTYGGRAYSTKVNVMDFTSPISRNMNLYEYKLDLKQNDPIWYDNTSEGELMAEVGKEKMGGFLIPFELPLEISGSTGDVNVINTGNSSVFPRIVIETPATNPEIINRTSGQSIKVNVVMTAGDKLVIDMAQKSVTLNGANVFGLVADGSTFFSLLVGSNIMSLVTDIASEETIAQIFYQSGFISI